MALQSGASPNHSPYWSPATGIQHLGFTRPAAIPPLQAHPARSFLSWSLILIPDTSYLCSQKRTQSRQAGEGAWRRKPWLTTGSWGFPLPSVQATGRSHRHCTTRQHQGGHSDNTESRLGCHPGPWDGAHFSLKKPKLETNLGVRPPPRILPPQPSLPDRGMELCQQAYTTQVLTSENLRFLSVGGSRKH